MKIDAYDTPDAEALLAVGRERRTRRPRRRRELRTQTAAAAAFLTAAVALAVLAPWGRPLEPVTLALCVAVFVGVERVKFPVADSWTYPTMLVFVPMLFLLPTPIVPLVVALAILIGAAPGYLVKRTPPTHIPSDVADAWYTLGPALVIVLGGAQHFAWSHWPVYVAALLAQFAIDFATSTARCWFAERTSPMAQVPLLTWIYIVDAALAPLGLLIAAAAVHRPALILLAFSPMVMLWLFARERKQRMQETLALSVAYRGTAMLLGDVVEADHHYTGAHSRDVVELSLAVADELGLNATRRRNVEFGALLHDVGKIHIPKEIINKPGKLNESEWELMRNHTIDGEQMLKQVGGLLASVGEIVRASHEHYDGGGYPDGLVADAIPIEARIVTACDAFSAMTTDRSYRKAMTKSDALAELQRCAGTQFDPRVVAAIHKLEGELAREPREWLDFLGSSGSVPAPAGRVSEPGQNRVPVPSAALASSAALIHTDPTRKLEKALK